MNGSGHGGEDHSDLWAEEVMQQFASNLRAAIGDRSLSVVARETGVSRSTIAAVIEGRPSRADLQTVARLERGLDASLWPRSAS